MIVISSSLVLGVPASASSDAIDGRNPRIGWHNLVTADNIAADHETADEPATNLANPATYLYWRGTTTTLQAVTVMLDTAHMVNYFGIAKHNLGSIGASVSIQYSTDGGAWFDASTPVVPNNDAVMIVEFPPVFARWWRLLIIPGSAPPAIAVWYFGEILALQRRIYVGHTPFPYGHNTTVSNGRSESGQFLGRVLRREFFESKVDMGNLTPLWYRTYMEPFVIAARTTPFFWSWRPSRYPNECGFAWLTDDLRVSNQRPNGMMEMSFSMQGVR